MILAGEIIKAVVGLLRTGLTGINVWYSVAPEGADYPFVTVTAVGESVTRGFDIDISNLLLQISVFDNDSSPGTTIEILKSIEGLLDRAEITISGGGRVLCSLKSDNMVRHETKDDYWHGIATYNVTAQKDA
jgi:hypothetical protein